MNLHCIVYIMNTARPHAKSVPWNPFATTFVTSIVDGDSIAATKELTDPV